MSRTADRTRILRYLVDQGPRTTGEIMGSAGVHPLVVPPMLAGLEAAGVVVSLQVGPFFPMLWAIRVRIDRPDEQQQRPSA